MRCGVGDYTERLAAALGKRENTRVAVLTDGAASQASSHPNYDLLPIVKTWAFADLPRILRAVRDWRPDIIHIQYPTQGYAHKLLPWLLPTIFRLQNMPVIQTWHEHFGILRRSLIAAPGEAVIVVRPDYEATMPRGLRWLTKRTQFRFIPGASTIPRADLTEIDRLATRAAFGAITKSLIVSFGFIYYRKGVDLLFDVLDPASHALVLIGELNPGDTYHQTIMNRIKHPRWEGSVSVTGFLATDRVATILAAADAAVFPIRDGGGIWNSSLHAASAQGTFILTTSPQHYGYCASENTYYARPGDVADMRAGLAMHIGQKAKCDGTAQFDWGPIAQAHVSFYQTLLGE